MGESGGDVGLKNVENLKNNLGFEPGVMFLKYDIKRSESLCSINEKCEIYLPGIMPPSNPV